MVEEDRDCLRVLKQIATVSGAMHSLDEVIIELRFLRDRAVQKSRCLIEPVRPFYAGV